MKEDVLQLLVEQHGCLVGGGSVVGWGGWSSVSFTFVSLLVTGAFALTLARQGSRNCWRSDQNRKSSHRH